jgi:hypothetical protein
MWGYNSKKILYQVLNKQKGVSFQGLGEITGFSS